MLTSTGKLLVEKDAQTAEGNGAAQAGLLPLAGDDQYLEDMLLW